MHRAAFGDRKNRRIVYGRTKRDALEVFSRPGGGFGEPGPSLGGHACRFDEPDKAGTAARTLVAACLQSGRLARAEQLRKEFSLV